MTGTAKELNCMAQHSTERSDDGYPLMNEKKVPLVRQDHICDTLLGVQKGFGGSRQIFLQIYVYETL